MVKRRRPPNLPGEHGCHVQTRLVEADYARLVTHTERLDVSISEWVRNLIVDTLNAL